MFVHKYGNERSNRVTELRALCIFVYAPGILQDKNTFPGIKRVSVGQEEVLRAVGSVVF